MASYLKASVLQEPSSATANLTLDASGGVTVGQNLTITGTTTLTGGLASAGLALKGSTSGTVTLVSPAVSGTNTVTIAAQTGTLNAAGPAFSAYASASQTVTNNTATKVAIDTESFDTNSNFDTTTNRFTPTVAGYYQVNGSLRGAGTTTFTGIVVYIYKNGSAYKRSQIQTPFSAGAASQIAIADVIYMNGSTDYIELYGVVAGTGTLTFSYASSDVASFFSACLVRGA